MKRRDFLKQISVICAATATIPSVLMGAKQTYCSAKIQSKGISHAELCELIEITLRDFPPRKFCISW
jgi:hypothetical protein